MYMECVIWIPCGCIPYFKKLSREHRRKRELQEKSKYIPLILQNNIERN